MQLRNKSVLLISPEPWDHIFISKHHYAVSLGRRNNQVFFLNPPGKLKSVDDTKYKNVRSVHYKGFPRGLRFYPGFLQQYFIRRRFHELEMLCNTRFDIVWSFDNSVFFDFSALPKNIVTISHIVDSTQAFQFEKAASSASLCVGVTRNIVDRLRKSNSRSFFVQHGYAERMHASDIKLPGNHAIRAGYAGNLNLHYIDWNLLDQITSEHMGVGFYFAGPYRDDHEFVRRVMAKPNTYFLGSMPSENLGAFYRQMDVLLLCYLADDYPEQLANSHKIMEYLGSGKVVVATYTQEYAALEDQGLIAMSMHNVEFPGKLSLVLNDLKAWNGPDRQKARVRWALDNSYEKQITRIQGLLNYLGNG